MEKDRRKAVFFKKNKKEKKIKRNNKNRLRKEK